jgi:predicted O-linked N-acetylglucosamine transferase (SPINDLY family)
MGMTPDVQHLLSRGVQEHQAGHLAEARRCYEQALQVSPQNSDALHLLGVVLEQLNEPQAAIEQLTRAVQLAPRVAEFVHDLGVALQAQNRAREAIECYRRALQLKPDDLDTLRRLGMIHLQEGHVASAVELLSRSVELNPDDAVARENLGIALLFDKQPSASIEHFQRLMESGHAVASTYHHLGLALLSAGRPQEALAHFEKTLEMDPQHVAAWEMLGQSYRALKRHSEAIATFEKGLEISPADPSLHCAMASVLLSDHQPDKAVEHHKIAIARAPGFARAHLALAGALMDQGLQDKSIEAYRKAIALQPELAAVESKYLFALHFSPTWTAEQIRDEIMGWARRHAAPLYPLNPAFDNDRSPHRPLRVGFVSSDFRSHPVGRFLAHLVERMDPAEIQIICFSAVVTGDEMTARFQRCAHQWFSTFALSEQQLADKIRAERIDILVDLSLFAFPRRISVFARRPAPVQLTYLAYPGTSGLATMDYRISDRFIDPPGTESLYSEQTLRIASYWCYDASPASPQVQALPATTNGLVTFGCLNNFSKVTQPVLRTWLQILAQVPNSRLLLSCNSDLRFEQIRAEFAARIQPDRLEQIRTVPLPAYFKLYQRIDIALDPHPFTGGTTTCDALYMGVPVVTLGGRNGVSRSGVSVLSQVGLSDLIAQSPAQYIDKACELARDVERLALLRSTLRQRMNTSPLMDVDAFVRELQATFRSAWVKWCQSKPGRDDQRSPLSP